MTRRIEFGLDDVEGIDDFIRMLQHPVSVSRVLELQAHSLHAWFYTAQKHTRVSRMLDKDSFN